MTLGGLMDEQQTTLEGFTETAATEKKVRKPKAASPPGPPVNGGEAQIISYRHLDRRKNNPEVGVVNASTDPDTPKTVWNYDPHLDPALQFDSGRSSIETLIDNALASGDEAEMRAALEELKRLQSPYLNWTGKAERTSFEVDTVSLHVHERMDPMSILAAVRKQLSSLPPGGGGLGRRGSRLSQPNLFEAPFESLPLRDAIDFYKHDRGWANRLVAGDSLLVMNSLLQKEGMAGQVQMIYLDPPYGIKYGSNFQPFVGKRDVKDRSDADLTQEPEMIKAFRDTWELGIHSYLTYLRDRLLLAKDLLSESGSVFVQISDENVHHVRELMDEVFGENNFVSQISFRKTSNLAADYLPTECDYILWYAKTKTVLKYRQHFMEKDFSNVSTDSFGCIEFKNGDWRRLKTDEKANPKQIESEGKLFGLGDMTSSHVSYAEPFQFVGRTFTPKTRYWSTTEIGIKRLSRSLRLAVVGDTLRYRRYFEDFPVFYLGNTWTDTGTGTQTEARNYVVQTGSKVIERCLLMTTDPGDLVLDPTCVRKGTMVVTPPQPPRKRGGAKTASGGEFKSVPAPASDCPPVYEGEFAFSPPPFTGGPGGDAFTPIESLNSGDYVYSHDGQPHKIIRTIRKPYTGTMFGIRHSASPATLWLTEDHRVLVKRRRYIFSGERNWSHNPHESFEKARKLRNNTTAAENLLWQKLRGKQFGVKFRRQHPIGPYIVDFFSPERALIIEVDGDSHFTDKAIVYDEKRTQFLTASGISVVRFTNLDIATNLEGVCERLLSIVGEAAEEFKDDAFWLAVEHLRTGDVVYQGSLLESASISEIVTEDTCEDVFDLEVEGAHSFLTEVCAVHNCGSGTTAYVAEKWGRRWITCDTSRVAVTLAKQRLVTASYDYFALKYPHEGLKGGFIYKTVPHVTLKSIAK